MQLIISDISFEMELNTLYISNRKSIINRIALEGGIKNWWRYIAEILLKPRDIFTLNKVKNSLQTILGITEQMADMPNVEPKVIFLEQNRVGLIFEIAEDLYLKLNL